MSARPIPEPPRPDSPQPTISDAFAERVAALYAEPTAPALTDGIEPEAGSPDAGRPRDLFRYDVGREVGRGGMGTIYEVWDRDIHRKLALKALSSSDVDDSAIARFVREARITGQLDHPGVVPVHDLGVDVDGRVYFTMRLIQGRDLRTIFELVDRGHSEWNRSRVIEVLLRVCDTVAYAHADGVIHRDLKPANVMVGDFGEVYVLDWGLAKVERRTRDTHDEPASVAAGDVDALDTDDLTLAGSVFGTPTYMSPEQAAGDHCAISGASDVYSLGAMLYTLFAGCAPYAEPGRLVDSNEVLERLRRGPPQPIVELTPETSAGWIAIVERAMARLPAARYPSAAEMAAAIRDTLEQERQLVREAERLRVDGDHARQAADFLVGLFQFNIPNDAMRRNWTVTELLANGVERVRSDLGDQPVLRGRLCLTLGNVYAALGMAHEALPLMHEAVDECRERTRRHPDNVELGERVDALASIYFNTGDYDAAERLHREAIALRRRAMTDPPFAGRPLDLSRSLGHLARLFVHRARYREALVLAQESLEIRERCGSATDIVEQLNDLGMIRQQLGDWEAGERALREALERGREFVGEGLVRHAASASNLGLLLTARGDHLAAKPLFQRALELRRRYYGGQHTSVTTPLNNLAMNAFHLGDVDGAEALFREVVELGRELDVGHPRLCAALGNLAYTLIAADKLDEAWTYAEEALDSTRRAFGEEHPKVAGGLVSLGRICARRGDIRRGIELFRDAIARLQQLEGTLANDFSVEQAKAHAELATWHLELGERAAARSHAEQARALTRFRLADDHELCLRLRAILAKAGAPS